MLKEHIALFAWAGLGSHFDEESAPPDGVEPRLRLRSFELAGRLTMEPTYTTTSAGRRMRNVI